MGGKDPGPDGSEVFGEQCRQDVGGILRILNNDRFPAFWAALRENCLKIRRGIETTPNSFRIAPFDATLTQRLQWLQANVLNPIEKLKAAIAEDKQPHFHHWEQYGNGEPPATPGLIAELENLERKATEIAEWLEGDRSGARWGAHSHNDEIRYYIVFTAIEELRKHFPEVKLTRGNWDEGVRIMSGAVPDYVRRVFLETAGREEQLNGQIQLAISALRKSRKKPI